MIVKRPVIQRKFTFAPFFPHIRLPMFTVCTYPCRIASDLQIDNCVLVFHDVPHLSINTGRTPLLSTRRIHPHECGTTPGQCASASVNHPCGCACSTEDSFDQQPSAAGKFRRGIRPSAPTSCRRTPFLLLAFPRVQLCPVLPFDLNVNLQPFLECHCPCTSFLPHWRGLQAANVRRLSVCIKIVFLQMC